MWEEERLHEVFYIKRLRLSLRQCVKKTGIEFKSDDDKVDIALEENSKIFKSIQVKSTINTFSKNSLEKWLQDLINDDVGANEFELFLIGQCNNDALTFINSIDKLQKNKLDATAQKSLQGFDTSIIQDRKISFKHIPFDVKILETLVRDSLLRYISNHNRMLTFDQISFIASATVNDQMISSTHGDGIDRKKFDDFKYKKRTCLSGVLGCTCIFSICCGICS